MENKIYIETLYTDTIEKVSQSIEYTEPVQRNEIWTQYDLIPPIAPLLMNDGDSSGVITLRKDKLITKIANNLYEGTGGFIIDFMIPYNIDESYNPYLLDANNNIIEKTVHWRIDWINHKVFIEDVILQVYTEPFKLTYFEYSGTILPSSSAESASNVGTGAEVYKQLVGTNLEFRTLTSASPISLTQNANDIQISSSAEANTASNVGAGAGIYKQKTGSDLELKSLIAGGNTALISGINDITINSIENVSQIYYKPTLTTTTEILNLNNALYWLSKYSHSRQWFNPFRTAVSVRPNMGGTLNKFIGVVHAYTDNLVYMIPHNADKIIAYNYATNALINLAQHGDGAGTGAYAGGAYHPMEYIVLAPYNSLNLRIYNITSNTYDTYLHPEGAVTGAYYGCVLLKNCKVLLIPHSSTRCWIVDITGTFTQGLTYNNPTAGGEFAGGVLLPNGDVVAVPYNSANIGYYEYATNIFYNSGHGTLTNPTIGAFKGGVLLPNGNIVFIPHRSTFVGLYNPKTFTYTNGPVNPIGNNGAFAGGKLLPNGLVVFAPHNTNAIYYYDYITNTLHYGTSFGPTKPIDLPTGNGIALGTTGHIILAQGTYSNIVGIKLDYDNMRKSEVSSPLLNTY